MNDMMLKLWVSAQAGVADVKERVRSQEGATTVEYIMILGIMALIVTALFLSPLGIRERIMGLGDSIIDALTGAADETQY